MNAKKLIASIYLYQTHAIKSLTDKTVIETNPVRLAKYYSENNADLIIVFDMSDSDAEHEQALDIMKEICSVSEVDVYGAGNVRRMEDIKKILYIGCKKAILNYSKAGNIEITKEVSLKFGKDKLLAAVDDVDSVKNNLTTLQEFVGSLLLMNPHITKEISAFCDMPLFVQIHQLAFNKLLETFENSLVAGVTGNSINENAKEIDSLKNLLKENGIITANLEAKYQWSDFKLNNDGMLPVVVQDYKTDEVLMVAYMNEESYQKTLETGKMCYFSRSRNMLWLKGDTSGHYQYVKSLTADCDMDTLLAKVSQVGAACHTGSYSCFFHEVVKKDYEENSNPLKVFEDVYHVILDRKVHPKEGSYTNYLFDKGIDKILKKLGEEATEIVIAAKNPNPNEVKYEISDFLYHMMVLMAEKNISWEEITTELANR